MPPCDPVTRATRVTVVGGASPPRFGSCPTSGVRVPRRRLERPSCERPSYERPSCESLGRETPRGERPSSERPSSERPSCERPSCETNARPRPTLWLSVTNLWLSVTRHCAAPWSVGSTLPRACRAPWSFVALCYKAGRGVPRGAVAFCYESAGPTHACGTLLQGGTARGAEDAGSRGRRLTRAPPHAGAASRERRLG